VEPSGAQERPALQHDNSLFRQQHMNAIPQRNTVKVTLFPAQRPVPGPSHKVSFALLRFNVPTFNILTFNVPNILAAQDLDEPQPAALHYQSHLTVCPDPCQGIVHATDLLRGQNGQQRRQLRGCILERWILGSGLKRHDGSPGKLLRCVAVQGQTRPALGISHLWQGRTLIDLVSCGSVYQTLPSVLPRLSRFRSNVNGRDCDGNFTSLRATSPHGLCWSVAHYIPTCSCGGSKNRFQLDAPGPTRTGTPIRAQALNLPCIPIPPRGHHHPHYSQLTRLVNCTACRR